MRPATRGEAHGDVRVQGARRVSQLDGDGAEKAGDGKAAESAVAVKDVDGTAAAAFTQAPQKHPHESAEQGAFQSRREQQERADLRERQGERSAHEKYRQHAGEEEDSEDQQGDRDEHPAHQRPCLAPVEPPGVLHEAELVVELPAQPGRLPCITRVRLTGQRAPPPPFRHL